MLPSWFVRAVARRPHVRGLPATPPTELVPNQSNSAYPAFRIGTSSRITLDGSTEASDHLVMLVVEPDAPLCFLTVALNGRRQPTRIVSMRSVVAYPLPPGAGPSIEIVLDTGETPDCGTNAMFAIHDATIVPFARADAAMRPRLGNPPAAAPNVPATDVDLLRRFVSLGDNCEFGLFARRFGADGASLLRFATVPLHGLVLAIEEGFEACYDPGEYYFEVPRYANGGSEYILQHARYELAWHTWVGESEATAPEMIRREFRKVCMLVRLFVESLEAGDRILVYKRNEPLSQDDRALLGRLVARFGPNCLLVVETARRKRDVGKVVMTDDGVMVGYIDRLLPYTAADRPSSDVWMDLCRAAFALWSQHKATRRMPADRVA